MLTNAIAPDKLGGLERYVRELSARLVGVGCEVTVIAKQIAADAPPTELATDGVRVLRYPVPSKKDPTFAVRYPASVAAGVRQALQAAGPYSVLHGHFPVPTLVPALSRTPYVYTLHAPVYRELLVERQGSYLLPGPVQSAARAALKRAEALVVGRAERIITLSRFMRAEVTQLDPAAAGRTEVLAGGIDTERFSPLPDPVPRGRGDGPVLFTARRMVPRTGVAQLVQAMPAVVAAHPDARLFVAGDGLQRPHIAAEIERLQLGDSVTLLGRISDEDLVDWYRRADLVVTPTQELEGFGLATAEALACGRPCLVTPAGANPELVSGVSEDLVAAGTDSIAIAAAVIRLLQPNRLAELAPHCRPAAHPAMGWAAMVERHLELYQSVLGAHGASRTVST